MERYDALNRYHAWYEHWHRYHWIAPMLSNQCVADMACGEGYGSALLGHYAKQVWALDIDSETIELAKNKYQHVSHVKYQSSDILKSPLESQSIDAVVSFETLEHLTAHDELLIEFKRVLKKSGLLIISTPDKNVYSDTGEHNEYHLKELTADEFKTLMCQHFEHVEFFGQQFQTNSLISPQHKHHESSNTHDLLVAQGDEHKVSKNQTLPTYLIAVASDDMATLKPFKELPASTFNDAENSLFKHYEAQVERLLLADQRLAELEQQIKLQSNVIIQLQARLGL